ncbi:MAG: RlmE family RNA methyltransferase [Deltaproteobacteria bacterium]|jgi:23S rRNA (uridine2552-2'-O)-methyltransferase|nr:RlmE family RNA methyltransferase [Deltaproteobacteria bacterium]
MSIKDRSRLDDHYSREARKEGYPARSVFKLAEFDQKYRLFRPGQKVLDLGCAPGSWTLYTAEKVGPGGLVVGLDLSVPPGSFPGNVRLLAGDLLKDEEWIDEILALTGSGLEAVLSDLAPKTSGRREVDQARSLELVEAAWSWTKKLLTPGGLFLFKLFQSQDGEDYIKTIRPYFGQIVRLKPKATRKNSQEIFILGRGFIRLTDC